MTIDVCQRLAQQANLPYFSLQYGACLGAVDLGMATSLGTSTACNVTCAGNPYQICGGLWSNSLYFTANLSYIGCYADTENIACTSSSCPSPRYTNRRLSYVFSNASGTMSMEACNSFALNGGFAYFSLQNGTSKSLL